MHVELCVSRTKLFEKSLQYCIIERRKIGEKLGESSQVGAFEGVNFEKCLKQTESRRS